MSDRLYLTNISKLYHRIVIFSKKDSLWYSNNFDNTTKITQKHPIENGTD